MCNPGKEDPDSKVWANFRSKNEESFQDQIIADESKLIKKACGSAYHIFRKTDKKKALKKVALALMLILTVGSIVLHTFHTPFRRGVYFWKGMGPIILEYKFLEWHGMKYKQIPRNEFILTQPVREFHVKTAPKLVKMIYHLGGMYAKIGQVMSTIGAGLMDREYIVALKPLQDGMPPRGFAEVSRIIEESTGKSMDEMFLEFDTEPLGAASVGQVHRAVLRTNSTSKKGDEVIVKVQYPENEINFEADLSSMIMATKILFPENLPIMEKLRERHRKELDFRLEAENLREVTANMQSHGVEPNLVRIPRVKNETGICGQNVLVMEFLRGVSLGKAIEEESDRIAQALGKKNAAELRESFSNTLKKHFQDGGDAGSGSAELELIGVSQKSKFARLVSPKLAAKLLRSYAKMRENFLHAYARAHNFSSTSVHLLTMGLVKPPRSDLVIRENSTAKFDLSKVLKTVAHVHGLQIMLDGIFNADPHPGNILLLEDGRLGLLDYGMVNRIAYEDRLKVAELTLAFRRNDVKKAAEIYVESGYSAKWSEGEIIDPNIIARYAGFHLDKFNLSPILLENGKRQDVMDLLRSTIEYRLPEWIENARRLGSIIIGVSAQAARPMSLSKEWEPIARRMIKNHRRRQKQKASS